MTMFFWLVGAMLAGAIPGLLIGFKAGVDQGFDEGYEAAKDMTDYEGRHLGIGA